MQKYTQNSRPAGTHRHKRVYNPVDVPGLSDRTVADFYLEMGNLPEPRTAEEKIARGIDFIALHDYRKAFHLLGEDVIDSNFSSRDYAIAEMIYSIATNMMRVERAPEELEESTRNIDLWVLREGLEWLRENTITERDYKMIINLAISAINHEARKQGKRVYLKIE
jgi:hypothetical protein